MVTSIRVRTNRVDRNWHGGCDREVATCSQAQVDPIINSLRQTFTMVDSGSLRGLNHLKRYRKRVEQDVDFKCRTLRDAILGQTADKEVTLRPIAFDSTQSRFDAILFHELMHAGGGT